jgi:anion-transporting  ArsA/GET3 family ATPase
MTEAQAQTEPQGIDALLLRQKLLISVGPGGVGKTTVSAAIALRAAELGLRTLVLTIDPAKRLADALGLTGLDDRIREVPTESLTQTGVAVPGRLFAAMFDNAASMDSLMQRVAPDAQTRDKVLHNRVYRAMAGTLARSHAYLAMERLHEVMSSNSYDLVILDTPPARNALDILDAPSRLATFLEEGVVKWFVRNNEKGWRAKLMAGSGAAAIKLFEVVVGKDLAQETVSFFEAFYGMREGFHERASAIQATLRAKHTSFVLVSSADATHLADAEALATGIKSRGVGIDVAVFNRSYERLTHADPLQIVTEGGATDAAGTADELFGDELMFAERESMTELLTSLDRVRTEAAAGNLRALAAIDRLARQLSPETLGLIIARLDGDIRDLPGLHALGPYLAASRALRA